MSAPDKGADIGTYGTVLSPGETAAICISPAVPASRKPSWLQLLDLQMLTFPGSETAARPLGPHLILQPPLLSRAGNFALIVYSLGGLKEC